MKEFTSQVGGRYTYIDDILNLQELSLAMVSLFDGCDNFIISGCQLSGTTLTPGYVYINGKIRYCAGTSGISTWPIYLYERNTVEKVSYADSGDKVGRNVYGCAIGTSVPTSADMLTGSVPQFIRMSDGGSAMRLKDAFFGKYALTVDSSYSSQNVNKSMALGGDLTVKGIIQSSTALQTVSGNNKGIISYNASGDLVIQSAATGRSAYQMVIGSDGAYRFYVGSTLLATLTSSGFVASVPIAGTTLSAGTTRCANSDLYNYGTAADTGAIYLNLLGYGGGSSYYRNTIIGNGKGGTVMAITGKTSQCTLYGDLIVSSSDAVIRMSHAYLAKTDRSLLSYINWQDKNGEVIATLGYASTEDYDLYLRNTLGSVRVESDMYVTGSLFVGGVDIMSVLVGKGDMTTALNGKANASDVYSKTDADNTFIKRTDSISVFVNGAGGGETGRKSVRNAIGAASVSDLNGTVQKSQLFRDIVSEGLPDVSDESYVSALNNRQRTLCQNIGAVYKDDAQVAQKDTGWIAMNVQNCGIVTKLYVRQVGHIVSIQGQLHTHHSGTIFTLPNSIDPPTYEIGYSHNRSGYWHCIIQGGSRDCVVDYCNGGCSEYIGFLMTYIV